MLMSARGKKSLSWGCKINTSCHGVIATLSPCTRRAYSVSNIQHTDISRYGVLVLWFCAEMSQFILCLLRGGKKISVAVVLRQLS